MEARKSFLLRVDPALWRELERWAADDLRSVNGQVEWILHQHQADEQGAQQNTEYTGPTGDHHGHHPGKGRKKDQGDAVWHHIKDRADQGIDLPEHNKQQRKPKGPAQGALRGLQTEGGD